MVDSLPLSVVSRQPLSVETISYRIWMGPQSKKIARANILLLLQKKGGELKPNETGVTRLTKMGIANGSAQRLLGDESDIQLGRIDQVAEKLGVEPWQLLKPIATQRESDEPPLSEELTMRLVANPAEAIMIENVARLALGMPLLPEHKKRSDERAA